MVKKEFNYVETPERKKVNELLREGYTMAQAWDVAKGRAKKSDFPKPSAKPGGKTKPKSKKPKKPKMASRK